MNQTHTVRRADEFAVGSKISVSGVPSMSNLVLDAITDSAAHVIKDGVHTTISRGSPCYQLDDVKEVVKEIKKTVPVVETVDDVETPKTEKISGLGKHGRPQGVQGKIVADKLAALVFPTEPFTMKQLVELTGIDQIYIFPFVRKNCQEVGEAEKPKGQRGRAAKLYLKK